MAVVATTAGIGCAIFFLRFCGEQSVPELPPAPEMSIATAQETARNLGERRELYVDAVTTDSRRFDLASPATFESMSGVFAHTSDRDGAVLAPGDSITRGGLRLSLSVKDISNTRRMMQLAIDNRSDKHLAYRIVTRPSKGTTSCSRKESVRHNAIVLKPGDIARRSECLYKRGWRLEIGKVETLEVPELGYFYLSAMSPQELGIDNRVAEGHRPPAGVKRCTTVLPARVKRAQDRGEVLWRDLVDFFARHSCEKYRFPHDYRAFTGEGVLVLPARGSVR